MSDKGSLIEIYHFINPLGKVCYKSEKNISEFAQERFEKVSIRFIPFVNLKVLKKQVERDCNNYTIKDVSKLYSQSYMSALGMYAASMQGKKYGRGFLMQLQKVIIEEKFPVNLDTFLHIARSSKLDEEIFVEDCQSSWVKERFIADQKLAQEMSIESTPSTVIYTSTNNGVGYLIESFITKEDLHTICQYDQGEGSAAKMKSNLIYLIDTIQEN